ncbi:Poly [ADP-ribose] polymerase 1 [Homalodisca vitripennis]|nr:Poly [ADP-ribose] polymerase 1 [Homalodisca vitripennis]
MAADKRFRASSNCPALSFYFFFDKNIERITDAMAFGWPRDCKKCKSGKLEWKSLEGGYKCNGNLTEWVQCDNVDVNPKRRPFVIPDSLAEEFASIKFKPKTGTRLIRTEERSIVLNPGPSTSSEGEISSPQAWPIDFIRVSIFLSCILRMSILQLLEQRRD